MIRKSAPGSNSVELKSVSVVSLKFLSVGREWTIVSRLSISEIQVVYLHCLE